MAAALIQTVAQLTYKSDNDKYKSYRARAEEIDSRARALRELLTSAINADADLFEKVMEHQRAARKAPAGSEEQKRHIKGKLDALKPATDLPLAVAGHCLELAALALELLDKGYQLAKGDTRTAAALALAGAEGALAAVDLNLKTYQKTLDDDWSREKRRKTAELWDEAQKIRSRLPALLSPETQS